MSWTDHEPGPDCFCGFPTVVLVAEGQADLLCFFHTSEAGATFPLPDERPENWPNLPIEELDRLMEDAYLAREAKEQDEGDIE